MHDYLVGLGKFGIVAAVGLGSFGGMYSLVSQIDPAVVADAITKTNSSPTLLNVLMVTLIAAATIYSRAHSPSEKKVNEHFDTQTKTLMSRLEDIAFATRATGRKVETVATKLEDHRIAQAREAGEQTAVLGMVRDKVSGIDHKVTGMDKKLSEIDLRVKRLERKNPTGEIPRGIADILDGDTDG